ncbi:MAG: sn-glycerol-3-phosphate ABC transporter ATP-binding protein UgpC [Candidatus Hydrogenedens sp.]|jgi:multiple sugar transport system ATP-binding protein|nr:sn-glycerol-3-phosphate ABC transporter ATP-binding protein UgpC [Candidatus Hydrogenedens sp.]
MAQVSLQNISKVFPGNIQALHSSSLDIKDGEFLVLVGPSGCGKSTLLRLIAGLEECSTGEIFIDGKKMNDVPPKARDIAMVFQNYALYPHMTVYKNLAFGLSMRHMPKQEIDRRVREGAELLEISEFLHRKPAALSGGQRQRVALGRALVRDPKVFLFDEPLSNLDAKLRTQMRTEIMHLHGRLKSTMIYVTHDQTEAMTMGDRIVVLLDGKIQQVDTPLNVYRNPANSFVAEFIGSPPINFFSGTLHTEGDRLYFQSEEISNRLALEQSPGEVPQPRNNSPVLLGIRPENLHLCNPDTSTDKALEPGQIDLVEMLGSESILHIKKGNRIIRIKTQSSPACSPGDKCSFSFDMTKALFFDKTDLTRLF